MPARKQREVTLRLSLFSKGRSPVRVYRVSWRGVRGGRKNLDVVAATAETARERTSRTLDIPRSRLSTRLLIKKGDFMPRGFSAAVLR